MNKKRLLLGIVIFVCLAMIIFVKSCQHKRELTDYGNEILLKDAINREKSKIIDLQNRHEQLKAKLYQDSIKQIASQNAFKREIKSLKVKLAQARQPVQILIDSIPSLDTFVDLQDSTIRLQDNRIDTLNAELLLQSVQMRGVITLTESQLELQKELNSHYQDLNKQLSKQIKRERNRKTFFKVACGVLAAGIVYQSVTN